MTGTQPKSRHPSDGALVRQLDGELGEHAAPRIARHLEHCAVCRERADVLRARSGAASAYVRSLPGGGATAGAARFRALTATRAAESLRSRVGRRWRGWAAAAAVASLVILSLGVDPLRAWMLARLGFVTPPASVPASRGVVLPPATVGTDGSVISFHPGSATFQLAVQAPQASGEIVLRMRGGESVTAQVVGAAEESLLVLPSGLRIENSAASSASYRITLPASITRIVIQVGAEAPRILPVQAAGGEWRIGVR